MLTIESLEGLKAMVGKELGTSGWYLVDQAKIDAFAQSTEDFTVIHVDEAKARAAGLATTIAHGLFTLSLGPKFLFEIWNVSGFSLGLNYGFEKVRFLTPVPCGSRLRMSATLSDIKAIPGGHRFAIHEVFEIEGQAKPACVADALIAFYS